MHFGYLCLFTSGRRDSNPRPPPWQGDVLPLNYFRNKADQSARKKCRLKDLNPRPTDYKSVALPTELSRRVAMRMEGLEPPRREALDPKSSASANSATSACSIYKSVLIYEPYRIRTCDPLIKSQLLYQLS